MRFVDIENLAGAFDLAAVQEGMELAGAHRMQGGFGAESVLANRHLLGHTWELEIAQPSEWTPESDVAVALATPPCSGFSTMTGHLGANRHGPDAEINYCMKACAWYAATQVTGPDGHRGPYVYAFESVQGAYKKGLELMRELRATFEQGTGWQYDLWHVLHSAASCGAAQRRQRYFFVVARVPLGWRTHPLERIVSYEDRIGDLAQVPLHWQGDPGGHLPHGDGGQRRWIDLYDWWEPWTSGRMACERYANAHGGQLPPTWDGKARPHETDSWHTPLRTAGHKLPNVITGHGGGGYVHWSEPRFLTAREAFRLMGFPDAWDLGGARSVAQAHTWSGKQMTIEAARWMLSNVKSSIEGRPGLWKGEQIGEREYVIDTTSDYKSCYDERSGARVDSRSKHWRAAMEARPE